MYDFQDVSATTLRKVIRPRILPRCGILIHETDGLNSLAYLQGGSFNSGNPVSADYLIAKTGEVYQITPPGWYAWHSGIASWRHYQEADKSINQGFVGVEVENYVSRGQKIAPEQYIALGWLVRRLVMAHGIDFRNITGHKQVALPAGRKTDPATLNWLMFTQELLSPSQEQQLYVVRAELS